MLGFTCVLSVTFSVLVLLGLGLALTSGACKT